MAVTTISRQYGSGGDEVAAQVCKMLGYEYFDKRLMAQLAVEVGLSPGEIVDFSEDNYKARNFIERLRNLGNPRVVAQTSTWTEQTTEARVK